MNFSCNIDSKDHSLEIQNLDSMTVRSYSQFVLTKNELLASYVKHINIDFSESKEVINQDSIFNFIKLSELKYLSLSCFNLKDPKGLKQETIQKIIISTDTITNGSDWSGFSNLKSLNISIHLSTFPSKLIIPAKTEKLTLTGNFSKIPEFVFDQTNLKELNIQSPNFDSLPMKLKRMTSLRLLNFSGTKFAKDLLKQNPDKTRNLKEINLDSCIIVAR